MTIVSSLPIKTPYLLNRLNNKFALAMTLDLSSWVYIINPNSNWGGGQIEPWNANISEKC